MNDVPDLIGLVSYFLIMSTKIYFFKCRAESKPTNKAEFCLCQILLKKRMTSWILARNIFIYKKIKRNKFTEAKKCLKQSSKKKTKMKTYVNKMKTKYMLK